LFVGITLCGVHGMLPGKYSCFEPRNALGLTDASIGEVMRLLVIGGTVFLGRHIVNAALAAGHQVTTMNRGTNKLNEQSAVEKIVLDRTGDLSALKSRVFDAVIDTCGYQPDVVEHSVDALRHCGLYIFISSVSAYGKFPRPNMTEHDAVERTATGEDGNYGTLKADCEAVVLNGIEQATIVRPGLIVGPYDPTDRFTYWPARVARGGKILAPGRPEREIQFIDVRDLSEWIVKLTQSNAVGVFNATGPERSLAMKDFLQICKDTVSDGCEFVWAGDDFLKQEKVGEWMELPLWIPDESEDNKGFMQMDCSKAFNAGLKIRPLAETIADTLAWDQTRPMDGTRKSGLKESREAELLHLLMTRNSA
jgi:2'-hydroxyisoflavone reductase